MGAKRNTVVLALLSLGVVLLWRTRALLTLAIGTVVGAPTPLWLRSLHARTPEPSANVLGCSWPFRPFSDGLRACMVVGLLSCLLLSSTAPP